MRGFVDEESRLKGSDWPLLGASMVGLQRLQNVQAALNELDTNGVAGAFVECGVWRGTPPFIVLTKTKSELLKVEPRLMRLVS